MMDALICSQRLTGNFDPMFGAAIILEDGRELPITETMVAESLDRLISQQDTGE